MHVLISEHLILFWCDMEGLVTIGERNSSELPLKHVSVIADINGYLVHTTSVLKYSNNSCSPLEVAFLLPVNESLAVTQLKAAIGERTVTADIMEKEEALYKYDNALSSGLSAAYGQELSSDVLSLTLGNLPPGDNAEITVSMVGELEIEADGILKFAISSLLKQRYVPEGSKDSLALAIPQAVQNTACCEYPFDLTVQISNPNHIAGVTSPTHTLKNEQANVYTVSGVALNDVVIHMQYHNPHQPFAIVEPPVPKKSTQLMSSDLVMLNFFPKFSCSSVPCELVFVVDRSGSMAGRYITCAAKTLQLFLRSIPSGCYFNIIGFGSHFKALFETSQYYNQETLDLATSYVESINADFGGTELLPPLQHVFKQPSITGYTRQVFVLTDGAVSNTQQVIWEVKRNCCHTRFY